MASEIQKFISSIINAGQRREDVVKLTAWGKTRTFVLYDMFDDSFILEEGIESHLENRDSIVLIPKDALVHKVGGAARVFGNVLTIASGNHAVTSIPLLSGKFWGLSNLEPEEQVSVLSRRMVCANIVGDTIEISQRATSTSCVVEMDEWLQALGLPMRRIVLADRVDDTLDFYAQRGQEWRIRQLAWTQDEMQAALRSSVSRIHSPIRYYHNVRGVHFLTYTNFRAWGDLIRTDIDAFLSGLSELCATSEEQPICNLLIPKYRGHHEVEFFGLPSGVAFKALVQPVRELWNYVSKADKSDPGFRADVSERFEFIAQSFLSVLAERAFADDTSPKFLEAIYRHLTGAVYQVDSDSSSRAFDDQKAALPGATYTLGNRYIHEGADARTMAILDYIEGYISHGDRIEWVNIYEIRSQTDRVRLGEGKSREIVFKTAWEPLSTQLIEKRLAQRSTGYGAYTLARTQCFQALGISYGMHRLLARNDDVSGAVHYYVRERYPCIPFSQMPASRFYSKNPTTGRYDVDQESGDIVRALIVLIGHAAAENLCLKKYTTGRSARFAEGKEIIEFGYDVRYGKEMPLRVHVCSIRGTLGWPDLTHSEENLRKCFDFYFTRYAKVIHEFALKHTSVSVWDLMDAFCEGFAVRTQQLAWSYASQREQFDAFSPRIFGDFKFQEKWSFALWALEQQRERLDELADLLNEKLTKLVGPESETEGLTEEGI